MKSMLAMLCCLLTASLAGAQEAKPDKYQATVDKGLAWLVKQQAKDGSWFSAGGSWPAAMTAFAGMALLADGSTLDQGKYAPNLRKALDWYHKNQIKVGYREGSLANPDSPGSTGRYMPEHGVALSFLAQLYLEAERAEDRAALRKLLNSAVAFSVAGQASCGGWFYTSKIEGHDASENISTMVQLQGLMDARNAGLAVPTQTLKRAYVHLKRCTTQRGGITYSGGLHVTPSPLDGGRPIISAMALAAFLPKDGRNEDQYVRRWLTSSAANPVFNVPKLNERYTDLLLTYYYSKVVFHLNEDFWREAFPEKKLPDHLKWVNYRKILFDYLWRSQDKDGSWGATQAWGQGPVFQTSLALNILLYESSLTVPRHQR